MFALQFTTELLFISVAPFGAQFFAMLGIKFVLNVLAKGRLMEKLNLRLDNWFGAGVAGTDAGASATGRG